MHKTHTIVATHDRRVCLSVCLTLSQSVTQVCSASLCKNGLTDRDPIWVNTLWGPGNIVLDEGPDPSIARGRGNLEKFRLLCTPTYLRNGEDRELKFCTHVEGWRP